MTPNPFQHACRLGLVAVLLAFAFLIPPSAKADESPKQTVTAGALTGLPKGRVAILPFIKGNFAEEARIRNLTPLMCPIEQLCLDLNEGDETQLFIAGLEKHLQRLVKKKLGGNLYSREETKAHYDTLRFDASRDTTLSAALTLAGKMKAEYILVPILWDYAERVGSTYAAESPASISLDLYLVSAQQERRVWHSTFSQTQQALTDNLLKTKDIFKFGGKWVTAEELAQAGMEEMLQDLPLTGNQ